MKKIFCAVCIIFSAAFFLNAEQDNGKLFPSREHYSIENIFYGFSGIFDFPNTFYNDNLKTMTGVGGGFSAEIGYNWSGWMLSAEYLRDIWATKNAAFVRLEKSRNNIFQLRIRRVLSNKTISKFPEWFSLVPGFGAGMNFMQGNYYSTQLDKDLGNYKQISFQDREGHSFAMRFSVEAAFDIFKNSEFIPFVGVDYNIVFNERISGGISGYPRVFLGFRRYPFKNSDRLQRFKKLLEYDQIKVTEEPPMEPHLRAIDDNSRVFIIGPGDEYAGERTSSQRSDDEDMSDNVSDDNNADDGADNEDKDQDVYYDDSDKKEDYYLPKDDDDNIDNELADDIVGDDGMDRDATGNGITGDDSMARDATSDDIVADGMTGDTTADAADGIDNFIGSAVAGAAAMPTLKISTNLRDGFTPDGDGIDDTVDFMFEATGLEYPPESWSVQIVDDAGNVVKSWSGYGDMPERITWDGITDNGELVDADREYAAIISAVPDARDAGRTGIGAVTETSTIRTGNFAGMDDGMTRDVTDNELADDIVGDDGMARDATDNDGMTGDATADAADDIDNFVDGAVAGAAAMPTLKISTNLRDGFTPDGDGIDDTVDFMFETTGLEYPPESWSVQIVDDAGNVVKSWSGYGDMPERITWDGITDNGELVDADREYAAIISAVPDARDAGRTGIGAVTETSTIRTGNFAGMDDGMARDATGNSMTGDTTADAADGIDNFVDGAVAGAAAMPTLKISTNLRDGFTPDGDGIDDTVDFMFEAIGLEYPPESWSVQIVDDAGNVVKTWSDNNDNVPEKITWNGITDSGDIVYSNADYKVIISVNPDERDTARTGITTVTDASSFRTGNLNDVVLPDARLLMSYSDGLSPDGDGNKDTVDFTFKTHGLGYAPESWKLEILDPVGNIIREWSGKGELPESITWDGTTDDGDIVVALSNYHVILSVTPDIRDRRQLESDTLIDRQVMRTGIITIDETDIQKEDLPKENQSTEETQPVEKTAEPEADKQLPVDTTDTTPSVSDEQPVGNKDVANTSGDDEQLPKEKDDTTTSASNEQPIEEKPVEDKTATTSPAPTEYATTKDEAKQDEPETPKIGTNRRQWRLISVPVYFDPDEATFNLISEESKQSNISVLNKIAAEIKKYGNTAEVIIEGHANNVSNTERENIEELIPLSQKRAEVVRQLLIERGIAADHLTAEGVGGSNPNADWTDRRNWWQNRRVEFIISVEE